MPRPEGWTGAVQDGDSLRDRRQRHKLYAWRQQYLAVYSGVGVGAGVGLVAGLEQPIGATDVVRLTQYTNLGGTLTVFRCLKFLSAAC